MATPLINPRNIYIGNDSATEFAISFPYSDRSQVHVYLKRYDSEETELSTDDYSFVSDSVIKFPKEGSSEAVLRTNDKLAIQRETPIESDYVFNNQKRLFPEDVMDADDLAFRILQEQNAKLDRTLSLNATSTADPSEVIMQVERVYSDLDSIDDVADNIADVNTVADVSDKIPTVAGIAEDISTVAGISANVTTVAGDKTNIDTVAGNTTNINTVAGISNDVTTVAGISSNVTAVANDSANIDAVAADLTNIDAASGHAADAAASALLAQAWATKMDAPVSGADYSSKYYAQLAQDIYDRIGTVIKIIGRVNTVADLPASGNTNGDCYLVGLQGATDFDEYYWLNDHWEFLGTTTVTLDFASIEGDPMDNTALASALNGKQDTLVSSTNIKTINGSSLLGSGDLSVASRNIGEIVASTIPLTDAGLHLLDGSLLAGGGIYSAFVTYIAGLVSTYPDLFETEANWQSAVTTYGVCGKFVYDSVNNTVRLPKITGIVEGTTDLTALGDLVGAGLPNITGEFDADEITHGSTSTVSGAFYSKSSSYPNTGTGASGSALAIGFDASRSSSVYGNSTTVQPQTIKVLYYIVVAASIKTDVEVDIDNIATDLNGKADKDLSNIAPTATAKSEIVSWGTPDYTAGVTRTANTTYSESTNGTIYIRVHRNGTGNATLTITIDGTSFNINCNNYSTNSLLFQIGENVTWSYVVGSSVSEYEVIYYPYIGG